MENHLQAPSYQGPFSTGGFQSCNVAGLGEDSDFFDIFDDKYSGSSSGFLEIMDIPCSPLDVSSEVSIWAPEQPVVEPTYQQASPVIFKEWLVSGLPLMSPSYSPAYEEHGQDSIPLSPKTLDPATSPTGDFVVADFLLKKPVSNSVVNPDSNQHQSPQSTCASMQINGSFYDDVLNPPNPENVVLPEVRSSSASTDYSPSSSDVSEFCVVPGIWMRRCNSRMKPLVCCELRIPEPEKKWAGESRHKVWLGTYDTLVQAARALCVGKFFICAKENPINKKAFEDDKSGSVLSTLNDLRNEPFDEAIRIVKMIAKHYALFASLQNFILFKGVKNSRDKYTCELRITTKLRNPGEKYIQKVWLGTYESPVQAARALDVGKFFFCAKKNPKFFSQESTVRNLSRLKHLMTLPLENLVVIVQRIAKDYSKSGSLGNHILFRELPSFESADPQTCTPRLLSAQVTHKQRNKRPRVAKAKDTDQRKLRCGIPGLLRQPSPQTFDYQRMDCAPNLMRFDSSTSQQTMTAAVRMAIKHITDHITLHTAPSLSHQERIELDRATNLLQQELAVTTASTAAFCKL